MRFVSLNHWYPAAWAAWQKDGGKPLHGTADYWDVALTAAGHASETLVVNGGPGIYEVAWSTKPDCVISMEVGRFPASAIRERIPGTKVVAFCSHRAEDAALQGFDCVFSSFPWMPDYCKSIGVRCEYLPLAFGRPVLDRVKTDVPRDIPVCFIGGLGNRIWDKGTRTMAAIAEAVPDFVWMGYIAGALSDLPTHLQAAYRGECWGRQYYETLARTKIMLNRHGEIAAKSGLLFGNNCRQYESTSMGAVLLTDNAGEFVAGTHCLEYLDAEDAIEKCRMLLSHPDIADSIAVSGREECLKNHCFENRVGRFLDVIQSL